MPRRHPGGLAQRIGKAAADFTRLLRSCGIRTPRDAFTEQLTEMEQLLGQDTGARSAMMPEQAQIEVVCDGRMHHSGLPRMTQGL